MLFIFVVENSIEVLIILSNLIGFQEAKFLNGIRTIRYLGVYPILQSFGLIFLKKTRDALDGISKLDSVHLVSST